jgi:LuxR family transcriptional regulator, maltose regulon positive regulatory protein
VAHALTAPVGIDSRRLAPRTLRGSAGIETGLLHLKSGPTASRPRGVPRERLVRRLLAARDVPIALLVAPTGYGKTTVMSQWAERDDRPFAWVTLDASDNDPMNLLAAIALALDAVEPVGWEVFEALSSGRSDAPTVALRRLARALEARDGACVLALDDVHVLKRAVARQWVFPIVRALGLGSQLALAGRSDAALPVGRLRVQGSSVELRANDLSMTRSEATALLRLAEFDLEPDQIMKLLRRTEGWPAGLSLAALTLRAQTRSCPDLDGFAGNDHFVAQYIREELLAALPPDQLEFLTRSSVLGALSGPTCDAVLEVRGSADMLARLARSNVLLAPTDRTDTWYRYHGLFREMLRTELDRLEPGRAALLHVRASEWCERHGDIQGAIGHAIDAHDAPRAGRLLWGSVLEDIASGRGEVPQGWLSRFTDHETRSEPLLALVSAASSLAAGNLYEAERWTSLAGGVSDGTDLVEAGVAILRAGIGREGVTQMGIDAGLGRNLLEEGSPWDPLCLFFEGVARHLTGDRVGARDSLQHGAHRAAVSAPMLQALCLAQLALLSAEDDDGDRAAIFADRARAQIERCGLEHCPSTALVFAVSAALRAERDRVDEARADLRRSLELLSRMTDASAWYAVQCRILQVRATLRVSGPARARDLLAPAAGALSKAPDAWVLANRLQAAQRDVDAAVDSIAQTDWSLTAAELRLLGYLPSHLSFPQIAERLFVSPNTVKTHARGIYRKLGVSCRGSAVDYARDAGLVDVVGERVH